MTGLIPWGRKRTEAAGNGGALVPVRDFPTLMRHMRNELGELFEHFARDWPVSWADLDKGWRWGMDVEDKEDCIVLRAEAPGFEAGDFDLQVRDNRLVLRVARKAETKDKTGECREQCECRESMTLPTGIDKDKIDARYRSGVLTVTIPKSAQGKAKRVAVKPG
jgi:HSP20 family protein